MSNFCAMKSEKQQNDHNQKPRLTSDSNKSKAKQYKHSIQHYRNSFPAEKFKLPNPRKVCSKLKTKKTKKNQNSFTIIPHLQPASSN